jgi:DNA invertase Pin-like site-specific DNA recombinase
VKTDRSGLDRAISHCGAGDVLVVWKLDRLGRSLIDLVALIEDLRLQGVGLRVLTGQGAMIDTTKADGRMILGIFAVLAEFERELIRERTKASMEAAKERGIHVGRPHKLSAKQIDNARCWLDQRSKTARQIAQEYGVSVSTIRRVIRQSKSRDADLLTKIPS